ncbi:hypothetical protein CPC08DRAFT_446932 [Agrocybe pediades]|nr:hypothetical protein CPC08DRAFT_446932 [Agrocybe pediades]
MRWVMWAPRIAGLWKSVTVWATAVLLAYAMAFEPRWDRRVQMEAYAAKKMILERASRRGMVRVTASSMP